MVFRPLPFNVLAKELSERPNNRGVVASVLVKIIRKAKPFAEILLDFNVLSTDKTGWVFTPTWPRPCFLVSL